MSETASLTFEGDDYRFAVYTGPDESDIRRKIARNITDMIRWSKGSLSEEVRAAYSSIATMIEEGEL